MKSERLYYRKVNDGIDVQRIKKLLSDPIILRYALFDEPQSFSVVRDWLSSREAYFITNHNGDFICLGIIKRCSDGYHVGYYVNPEFHGRGYATEVCRHLISTVFNNYNVDTVYATCHLDNLASYKVMLKSCMVLDGGLDMKTPDGSYRVSLKCHITRRLWLDLYKTI